MDFNTIISKLIQLHIVMIACKKKKTKQKKLQYLKDILCCAVNSESINIKREKGSVIPAAEILFLNLSK